MSQPCKNGRIGNKQDQYKKTTLTTVMHAKACLPSIKIYMLLISSWNCNLSGSKITNNDKYKCF